MKDKPTSIWRGLIGLLVVPIAGSCVVFFLQGAIGGRLFELVVVSVVFLYASAQLQKEDFLPVVIVFVFYALYAQGVVWDRYLFLVSSLAISLVVPWFLLPFVSQIDESKGFMITHGLSFLILVILQGIILNISPLPLFGIFVVLTCLLFVITQVLFVKDRFGVGH